MDVNFFPSDFWAFKGSTECAAHIGCTESFDPVPSHMSVNFYFEYKFPGSAL